MTKTLSQSFSAAQLHSTSQRSPTKDDLTTDQYVSERVFKDRSPLCRVAMPYIMEQPQSPPKKIEVKEQLARRRKRLLPQSPPKPYKPFKPTLNYQKTPMNEFLNYELSEQINFGLKEVKMLADEIKHIKVEKQKEAMQGEEKRMNKKIRIRPTNFKHKKQNQASSTCLR